MHGLKNGFENVLICIISRFRPILNFSIFGKNGASLELLNIVTVFENSLPKGSSGEIKRNSNFLNRAWRRNACTLVPTIFRWHGKKEFKCHIHSSFSHDIDKQIWILLFAFRFRLTLKNGFELRISFFAFASLWKTDINFSFRFSFSHHFEKRIWISFFLFRFRITLKNGFEFRFSFSHHFEKQIWISFVIFAWLEKRITAPVQSFEAPPTPSGLTGAFTFYVCESKWIFLSPGPKWVVNSPHPLPMICLTHTRYCLF